MAMEFDGVDQNISFTALSSLNNVNFASIMAWFLIPENNVDTCTIIDISGSTTGTRAALVARTAGGGGPDGGLSVQARGAASDSLQSANTPAGFFQYGVWNHFVGQINYVGGVISIYLNGNPVLGAGVTLTAPTDNIDSLATRIGVDAGGTGDATTGFIDDVRVYNRLLGASEIKTIFTARGNDAILQGAQNIWRMNEQPPGTVATAINSIIDLGQNPRAGTPINNPVYASTTLRFAKRFKSPIGLRR